MYLEQVEGNHRVLVVPCPFLTDLHSTLRFEHRV